MKKTLALLLTSSALLVACSAEEPEAAEETVNESATDAVDEVEEQLDDIEEEYVEGVDEELVKSDTPDDDSYFSDIFTSRHDNLENRLEDASEFTGLYAVSLPETDGTAFSFPRETFIDIKADGRATVVTYEVIDVVYHEDEDTISDANVSAYVEEALKHNSDATWEEQHAAEQINNISIPNLAAYFMYVDEQNNSQTVKGRAPYNVSMASGYLVQQFGEIQFQQIEHDYIMTHYNEQGELTLSDLLNESHLFLMNNEWSLDVISLDTATLSETEADNVPLSFLVNEEGLKSTEQIRQSIVTLENEREQKRAQFDVYNDNYLRYIDNHNELMKFLILSNDFNARGLRVAPDPSEYNGYMQDNTEIVPDVVFIQNGARPRTLHTDGTILQYNDENGTWNQASY